MARISLLFAHPALEKSSVDSTMLQDVQQIGEVTIKDLCQQFPFFNTDTGHYAPSLTALSNDWIENRGNTNYLNELLPII